MPGFVRSGDGITTEFGEPVADWVGVGSPVYIGEPLSSQLQGTISGAGVGTYSGDSSTGLVLTGGDGSTALATTVCGGMIPGHNAEKKYEEN